MSIASAPAEVDPVELVLGEIRRRGGRATAARRLVLRTLFDRSGHCTAPELAEQVGRDVRDKGLEIHLSTIYRFLDELEELGVVTHSHLGQDGPSTTFRLSVTHTWCASDAAL